MKSKRIVQKLTAFALAGGLSLTASAQVGSGWTSYSPGKHMQEVGNVTHSVSGSTETFSINSSATGEQRCEERVEDDFSTSTRQFEGMLKVVRMGGTGISVEQEKSVTGGTWLMIAAKHDGSLYTVNGGTTIATGVIGNTVRINVITDCSARTSKTYVNGSLKATLSNITLAQYHKYGAYRLNSGYGPCTVQWSNVKFWKDGSASGGGGGGTTVSFEAENLSVGHSGTGTPLQTDANSSNGKWISLDAENTGSWMEFTTGTVQAGTYSVKMMWKGNNNRGQLSLKVDGTQVGGTLDQYSSGQTYPTTTFGNVTFGSSGTHKIRLTVTGKNSSSSNYVLSADKFTFTAQ